MDEQSALHPLLLGHPPRSPAQSACTTRPDDHPSPGAVQSARGRLPGAKIGVNETLDRAGDRVHGLLKRPPGEHRAEERLIALDGGGGRGDLAEVGYERGDLSLLGGGRGLADLGDRLPCLPFALLAGERAGLERQRRRPIRCVRLASGGMPVRAMDRHRGSRLHLPRGRNNATHITLHEIAHMFLGHEHTAARDRFVRLLAPDVDKVLIQLMLGRSASSTAEERDAETLASLILTSVKR
jgi:hypothetical protein